MELTQEYITGYAEYNNPRPEFNKLLTLIKFPLRLSTMHDYEKNETPRWEIYRGLIQNEKDLFEVIHSRNNKMLFVDGCGNRQGVLKFNF